MSALVAFSCLQPGQRKRKREVVIPNYLNNDLTITVDDIIQLFIDNRLGSENGIVNSVETLARRVFAAQEQSNITACDLLCCERAVQFFDIDTYWIFHLFNIMDFSKYIEFMSQRKELDIVELFIRQSLLNKDTELDPIMSCFSADMIKYLYLIFLDNSTCAAPLSSTLRQLFINTIFPPNSMKILDEPSIIVAKDIVFLLESIGNNIKSHIDFSTELLVILFSYSIPFSSFVQGIFHSQYLELLYAFPPCIIFSSIDCLIKEESSLVLEYQNRSNTIENKYAIDLLLESACFVHYLSNMNPDNFHQSDKPELLKDFQTLSEIFSNDEDQALNFNVNSLVELCTSICLLSIRQGNQNLFLRSVCFVDVLTSNAINTCRYLSIGSSKKHFDRFSSNVYFQRFLSVILTQTISNSEFNNGSLINILQPGSCDIDTQTLKNSPVLTSTQLAMISFICSSLATGAIAYQNVLSLQATFVAMKNNRNLCCDIIDDFLVHLQSTLRAKSQTLCVFNDYLNEKKEGDKENTTLISIDRLMVWIQSYKTSNILSVGLNHACTSLGHRVVLKSFEYLLESNPTLINICKSIIDLMVKEKLCLMSDAQNFYKNVSMKCSTLSTVNDLVSAVQSQLQLDSSSLNLSNDVKVLVCWFSDISSFVQKGQTLSKSSITNGIRSLRLCIDSILKTLNCSILSSRESASTSIVAKKSSVMGVLFKLAFKLAEQICETYLIIRADCLTKCVENALTYCQFWQGFMKALFQALFDVFVPPGRGCDGVHQAAQSNIFKILLSRVLSSTDLSHRFLLSNSLIAIVLPRESQVDYASHILKEFSDLCQKPVSPDSMISSVVQVHYYVESVISFYNICYQNTSKAADSRMDFGISRYSDLIRELHYFCLIHAWTSCLCEDLQIGCAQSPFIVDLLSLKSQDMDNKRDNDHLTWSKVYLQLATMNNRSHPASKHQQFVKLYSIIQHVQSNLT